ncbi:hypothetical protein ACIQI8_20765 [Streptomyces sp. NPDC092369]|uniref:hypothetical protein n=1 Tax=Streptomyces sp. NPDC092369 TaxID=3366015 RepID=UPI0037FDC13D
MPNLVIHPRARTEGDGIWFLRPPGFISLPLDSLSAEPASRKTEALRDAMEPLLATAPDEPTRQRFAADLLFAERLFATLRTDGTVHCSLGLHRNDTGSGEAGMLLSLFTVTWVNTAWAPRGVTAARAVTAGEGHAHLEYAEMPCGPASFSESVRTPRADSGIPQMPLLQFHAHLPHPDGTSLALLTLSTTATAHRDTFRGLLRQIAELVSFDDPFAAGSQG